MRSPTLSVVIASVNGLPLIEQSLACLGNQQGDVDAEVIVVDSTGEQTTRLIESKFPTVKLVAFAERRTIPELRATGLAHSKGEIVAIVEDHCSAEKNWYLEIVKAHRDHPECLAIGGAVENGKYDSLVDWAAFFCEYSSYMLPLPSGVAMDIPGNNVSYKRRAFEGIDELAETLSKGFWESTLHQKLAARGARFWLEPSIVVYHDKPFGVLYFLSQRYHYSRYYAGTLFAKSGVRTRGFRSLVALALPPLLMGRIVTRVARRRRLMKELLLTLPLIAVFTVAWAVGELVGCVAGAGQSLSRVE